MFKIEGEYTSATIFTDNIEEGALKQVYNVCNNPAFEDSNIAIMPDVHKGAGICIGFTAELKRKIIPNVVGVDIGCGMTTTNLGQIEIDLEKLDKFINENIPSGFDGYETPQADLTEDELMIIKNLNLSKSNHRKKLGTAGGGNHFLEISVDSNGNKYLVVHSGSRNFGYKVAKHYQDKAENLLEDKRKKEIKNKIEELKSQNKHHLIEKELNKIRNKTPKVRKNLRYLTGKLRDEYLRDMKIAQNYAKRNRRIMSKKIIEHLGLSDKEVTIWDTIHNYIGEDNIIRKGAISAKKGEKVLIPLNMRDGSLICIGKGNEKWNNSAPHGAGRLMSRTQAKEELDFDSYKESMKGIYTSSVNENTLDEAPGAYKDYREIIKHIEDTVKIVEHIKPIYNYKES
jgi:RNA-splicing ligase RtcB